MWGGGGGLWLVASAFPWWSGRSAAPTGEASGWNEVSERGGRGCGRCWGSRGGPDVWGLLMVEEFGDEGVSIWIVWDGLEDGSEVVEVPLWVWVEEEEEE